MSKDEFSTRLHEARLMMKYSMAELAERTGGIITKQSISRYENGIMRPKQDALQALAKALDISEGYFVGAGLQVDKPMLRISSRDLLTEEEMLALESRLSFWTEQYLAKERVAGLKGRFGNPVQGTCISTLEDAIQAADLLRERWHCGDGPIPSVLRLMERKGIKILSTDLPDEALGLSTWADGAYPLVMLDMRPERTTVERLRFTAAHELAHLLFTFPEDSELRVEKRCDLFAGFFLMPKRTFIEEMGASHRDGVTLEEMIDLKNTYGLSLQALVIAARYYGIITPEYKRWWYDKYPGANPMETGWGHYQYPETIGREMRVNSIVESKKEGKSYECNRQ